MMEFCVGITITRTAADINQPADRSSARRWWEAGRQLQRTAAPASRPRQREYCRGTPWSQPRPPPPPPPPGCWTRRTCSSPCTCTPPRPASRCRRTPGCRCPASCSCVPAWRACRPWWSARRSWEEDLPRPGSPASPPLPAYRSQARGALGWRELPGLQGESFTDKDETGRCSQDRDRNIHSRGIPSVGIWHVYRIPACQFWFSPLNWQLYVAALKILATQMLDAFSLFSCEQQL